MKVYIAGPMQGYPNLNFDSFDAARDRLVARGYEVVSPADLDREYEVWGKYPPEDFVPSLGFKRRAIRRDVLHMVDECDKIYLLNGWKGSEGVGVELPLAKMLRFDIMFEEGGNG